MNDQYTLCPDSSFNSDLAKCRTTQKGKTFFASRTPNLSYLQSFIYLFVSCQLTGLSAVRVRTETNPLSGQVMAPS